MLLFLYGPDTYRSLKRLRFLEEGFRTKYDTQGFSVVRLDGESASMDDVRQAVITVGFLSAKRLVILERFLSTKRERAGQDELRALFAAHAEHKDLVLLVWEGDVDALAARKTPSPLLAYLLKEARCEAFPLLSDAQLRAWVVREVRARNGTIGTAAVTLLLALTGNDLWQLAGEMDKLTAYAGKEEIGEGDVRLLVRGAFDADIFRLTDALAARQVADAMQLIDAHLAHGEPPLALLTMLVRQVRTLLIVKSAEPRTTPQDLAKRFGIHPFVVRKAAVASRRFSLPELAALYDRLFALDRKLKSSQVDARLLFARLVAGVGAP